MVETAPHVATQDVLGLPIALVGYDEVLEALRAAVAHGRPLGVAPVAVHAVMEATASPDLLAIYRRLDLVLADGHGVRLAVNRLAGGKVLADRVHGPDLVVKFLPELAARGGSVFLYGGNEQLGLDLERRLPELFPGLIVAGRRASRFRPNTAAEFADDVAEMRASGADLVLVGLGTPRQDLFIFQTVDQVERPMIAVGVGFSYLAGHTKEPPRWIKDNGLQWLHRLIQDPVRLWHRYLVLNPIFVVRVLWQQIRTRRRGREHQLTGSA